MVLWCNHCRSIIAVHLLTLFFVVPAMAQTRPPAAIRADTVWSGQVEIDSDVSIVGAEVRVEAGTTIRFTGKSGKASAIRLASPLFVGGERSRTARLVLAGQADRPIVVETAQGSAPGSIEAGSGTTSAIDARFVTFRGLGGPADGNTCRPSLVMLLASADDDVWLTDCRFERCGPVHVGVVGPDAGVEISGCTFDQTCGTTVLGILGGGTGVKVVRDNVADAGFEIASSQALVQNNVLVGRCADVVVRRMAAEGVAIRGNYVHNTTDEDMGRYALRCESPAAIVEDNVLMGGSYVVETAPRTVRHNVIVGAGDLRAKLGVDAGDKVAPEIRTMSHSLVTNICPDAVLADNLLLGPAYASVSMTQRCDGVRIDGNVFDGWGTARRAVECDITATGERPVTFVANIVTGYQQAPFVSQAKNGPRLETRSNVFPGVEGALQEGFASAQLSSTGDDRVASLTEAGLGSKAGRGSPATQAAASQDDLLMARRKSVADVLRQWFAIYERGPESAVSSRPR
jgi:hypothetical protein